MNETKARKKKRLRQQASRREIASDPKKKAPAALGQPEENGLMELAPDNILRKDSEKGGALIFFYNRNRMKIGSFALTCRVLSPQIGLSQGQVIITFFKMRPKILETVFEK